MFEIMTRKQELECIFWDVYKDAYGIRPRHVDTVAMSEAELEERLEYLSSVIERNLEEQRDQEQLAILVFEQRVQQIIEMGAGDRETAVAWLHEAEDTMGDNDYLCYKLGLPYHYLNVKEAA